MHIRRVCVCGAERWRAGETSRADCADTSRVLCLSSKLTPNSGPSLYHEPLELNWGWWTWWGSMKHTQRNHSQSKVSVFTNIYKYECHISTFFSLCLHNKTCSSPTNKRKSFLEQLILFFFPERTKVVIPSCEGGWTNTGDDEVLFLPSFMWGSWLWGVREMGDRRQRNTRQGILHPSN